VSFEFSRRSPRLIGWQATVSGSLVQQHECQAVVVLLSAASFHPRYRQGYSTARRYGFLRGASNWEVVATSSFAPLAPLDASGPRGDSTNRVSVDGIPRTRGVRRQALGVVLGSHCVLCMAVARLENSVETGGVCQDQ